MHKKCHFFVHDNINMHKKSQTLCMKIIKSNERFYLFADKLEGSGTKVLNSQSRDKSRRNSFENRTLRGTKKTDNRKIISLLCFLFKQIIKFHLRLDCIPIRIVLHAKRSHHGYMHRFFSFSLLLKNLSSFT